MPPAGPARPRVSRETRLLLITALVSLMAIWALARLRFPDRPVSPNSLPPVLTQLAPRSSIEEIPALITDLTPRLAPLLVPVTMQPALPAIGRAPSPTARVGLRVSDDAAVVLLEDGMRVTGDVVVLAHDRVSGLALVAARLQSVAAPATWIPRRPDLPRYLLAADAADLAPAFRPVFVGALVAARSEVWPGSVWILPARIDIAPGEMVFAWDGALAGLVVSLDGRPALVPAQSLVAMADRLIHDPPGPPAHLGVRLQPMTGAIASATGAGHGLVVTDVEPGGPAASHLDVADVIEAADGHPIVSLDGWRARLARLAPGDSVALRVRRAGGVLDIRLTAAGSGAARALLPHGLTMRSMSGIGAEVIRVEPGSSAARAGLVPGDVITYFDGLRAPGGPQISRAYAAAPEDRPVLVAITRGGGHHVLTMQRSP